jgi:hypothetical protein
MPDYPTHVHGGTTKAVFERCPDLYAVRETPDAATADAVAVIPDDAASTFAVYKGAPPKDQTGGDVGPVYSAGPGGPLAVPTGRVFVRLAPGVRADERRDQFEAAGFRIEKTLSYAPNAAWLCPSTGSVAEALPRLDELEKLPDVEHVEPQLLMERSLRR